MTDWQIDDEQDWGDALPPLAALVAALGDVEDDEDEDAAMRAQAVDIDRITLSLAIEMTVEPAGPGALRVRGSTPTQWTETTIMPVFHKLTVHIEKAANGEE